LAIIRLCRLKSHNRIDQITVVYNDAAGNCCREGIRLGFCVKNLQYVDHESLIVRIYADILAFLNIEGKYAYIDKNTELDRSSPEEMVSFCEKLKPFLLLDKKAKITVFLSSRKRLDPIFISLSSDQDTLVNEVKDLYSVTIDYREESL